MYKILKVRLINLNTHVDTVCEFPTSGAVMVSGINVDKDLRSNGSGKSSIAEAISVALTGESFRHCKTGSSVKDLVRNGEKQLTVELHLKGKDNVFVSRTIKNSSKPSELIVKVNGETPRELPTSASNGGVDIDAGNKHILNVILGISKDDLFNYYLLSKDTFKSFLTSTDTEKKKVINRFSGIDKIDPVFDVIKQDLKDLETKNVELEKNIFGLKSKVEVEEEHLQKHKASLANDVKQQRIDSITAHIRQSESAIEYLHGQLQQVENDLSKSEIPASLTFEIERLRSQISKYSSDTIEIKIKLETEQDKVDSLNKELRELKNIRDNVDSQIKGAVVCPKCAHEFSLSDKDFDVKEAISVLSEIAVDISNTQCKFTDLNDEIAKLRETMSSVKKKGDESNRELQERENERKSQQAEIESLKASASNFSSKLKIEKAGFDNLVEALEVAKNSTYDFKDESSVFEKKIEAYRNKMSELEIEIATIKESSRKLSEQEGRFKKFKNYLSNQSLSVIELETNKNLAYCGSDLSITLDGYRELRSGEVREQITCVVNRNSEAEGSVNKLSGGEKATVICANIKALQSIINSTCGDRGLDFTFFDEVNDSVDATGMSELYDALNRLQGVSLLVSHVRDVGFDNHIFVKKEKGISSIVDRGEYKILTGN